MSIGEHAVGTIAAGCGSRFIRKFSFRALQADVRLFVRPPGPTRIIQVSTDGTFRTRFFPDMPKTIQSKGLIRSRRTYLRREMSAKKKMTYTSCRWIHTFRNCRRSHGNSFGGH